MPIWRVSHKLGVMACSGTIGARVQRLRTVLRKLLERRGDYDVCRTKLDGMLPSLYYYHLCVRTAVLLLSPTLALPLFARELP